MWEDFPHLPIEEILYASTVIVHIFRTFPALGVHKKKALELGEGKHNQTKIFSVSEPLPTSCCCTSNHHLSWNPSLPFPAPFSCLSLLLSTNMPRKQLLYYFAPFEWNPEAGVSSWLYLQHHERCHAHSSCSIVDWRNENEGGAWDKYFLSMPQI